MTEPRTGLIYTSSGTRALIKDKDLQSLSTTTKDHQPNISGDSNATQYSIAAMHGDASYIQLSEQITCLKDMINEIFSRLSSLESTVASLPLSSPVSASECCTNETAPSTPA
ncbi:unnamed protein product [Protopolystoma xenopodis]|uniref:Uncharacterized protein n=1 Tax=Protopolystoma xenopodis TaxID=117903 RepID=A0A3S5BWU2_9PLAT|nr:unnamed protein product [Protopolystoma xenopodis]